MLSCGDVKSAQFHHIEDVLVVPVRLQGILSLWVCKIKKFGRKERFLRKVTILVGNLRFLPRIVGLMMMIMKSALMKQLRV